MRSWAVSSSREDRGSPVEGGHGHDGEDPRSGPRVTRKPAGHTLARENHLHSKTAQALPFFAPVQLLIVSVIVVPSLYVLWLSLNASSFGQAPTFVGLANYVRVLTDPGFLRALSNTAVIVVFAVHLELGLGLGMALLF